MNKTVSTCRLCGNDQLASVLNLGDQCLTGVFPKNPNDALTRGPLELLRCCRDDAQECCGLVQLGTSYAPEEMYGENYGYRSGLNRSMVDHLEQKAHALALRAQVSAGDVVLDIGSNDGTLLSFMPPDSELVGIDPSSEKFGRYYKPHIKRVPEFFSLPTWRDAMGDAKAKLVTSIAMFYDIEDPLSFAKEVREVLADDGVWHTEQSYLPLMLQKNAYDTICHEHVEYYALRQLHWILQRCGMKLIDVELNDVNGGSFAVTAAPIESKMTPNQEAIDAIEAAENDAPYDQAQPYAEFAKCVEYHRSELIQTLKQLREDGKSVVGYGASTKGNVLLQYCGLSEKDIPVIAEVNPDKFGSFTPGTSIPIVSEAEAKALKPDVFLVLPWHFRDNFVTREKEFLARGGAMLFPLPTIELVRG